MRTTSSLLAGATFCVAIAAASGWYYYAHHARLNIANGAYSPATVDAPGRVCAWGVVSNSETGNQLYVAWFAVTEFEMKENFGAREYRVQIGSQKFSVPVRHHDSFFRVPERGDVNWSNAFVITKRGDVKRLPICISPEELPKLRTLAREEKLLDYLKNRTPRPPHSEFCEDGG
jgi:hypothetical protein